MTRIFKIVLILCACLLSITVHAQVNYVRNGSFEQYSACPFGYDQIRFAKYWQPIDTVDIIGYGPVCSPEYCNACAGTNGYCGVPHTFNFNHYPRTGDGMMEIQAYYDNVYPTAPYQRDYAQGKLYDQLLAGKHY